MQELAFRTLLYRYFFFGWLFKDASRGNLFERSAAWRFNQAHAHWLRHSALAALRAGGFRGARILAGCAGRSRV